MSPTSGSRACPNEASCAFDGEECFDDVRLAGARRESSENVVLIDDDGDGPLPSALFLTDLEAQASEFFKLVLSSLLS
jgi:hypothetical protein